MGEKEPLFTVKDWERFLQEGLVSTEERKREATRWTAAAATIGATAGALLLDRISTVSFGPDPMLGILVLLIGVAIAVRAVWEAFESRLADVVRTLTSSKPDEVSLEILEQKVEEIQEARAIQVLWAVVGLGVFVTILLGTIVLAWPGHPQAGTIVTVIALRVFALAGLAAVGFGFRRIARGLLQWVDKQLDTLPAEDSQVARQTMFRSIAWPSYVAAAFDSFQLWLLWPLLTFQLPATMAVLQIGLLMAVIFACVHWMREVTWPAASEFSRLTILLAEVRDGIRFGYLREVSEIERIVAPVGVLSAKQHQDLSLIRAMKGVDGSRRRRGDLEGAPAARIPPERPE